MQPSVLTNHVMLHNFRKRNNTFDNFCDGQFTHYLYSIVRPNQTTNSSTVDKKPYCSITPRVLNLHKLKISEISPKGYVSLNSCIRWKLKFFRFKSPGPQLYVKQHHKCSGSDHDSFLLEEIWKEMSLLQFAKRTDKQHKNEWIIYPLKTNRSIIFKHQINF